MIEFFNRRIREKRNLRTAQSPHLSHTKLLHRNRGAHMDDAQEQHRFLLDKGRKLSRICVKKGRSINPVDNNRIQPLPIAFKQEQMIAFAEEFGLKKRTHPQCWNSIHDLLAIRLPVVICAGKYGENLRPVLHGARIHILKEFSNCFIVEIGRHNSLVVPGNGKPLLDQIGEPSTARQEFSPTAGTNEPTGKIMQIVAPGWRNRGINKRYANNSRVAARVDYGVIRSGAKTHKHKPLQFARRLKPIEDTVNIGHAPFHWGERIRSRFTVADTAEIEANRGMPFPGQSASQYDEFPLMANPVNYAGIEHNDAGKRLRRLCRLRYNRHERLLRSDNVCLFPN